MDYNTKLADRVREMLAHLPDVEEKKMFSGVCFMVDGKMCVCVGHDELLCRIGSEQAEIVLAQHNECRQMINNGRAMKDYIYVSEEGYQNTKDLDKWVKLALEFNPKAKAAKKRK